MISNSSTYKKLLATICVIEIAMLLRHFRGSWINQQLDLDDGPNRRSRPRRYGIPNRTSPLAPHPHAGAVDEFGHYGYVHDPTILLESPSTFQVLPEERTELCDSILSGMDEVTRTVFEQIQVTKTPPTTKDVKVFCAIYTYPGNNNQTNAIRETWGRRCDGFMAASTETNHSLATVNLPHHGFEGQYKGIWQKVRSMLGYIYDNFLETYDFYYFCGDDTYVIMENMKAFLTSPKLIEYAGGPDYPNPVFAGAWTHPLWFRNNPDYDPTEIFMGGGAGYVLSKKTVRILVKDILPHCHDATNGSAEDVYMSQCLKKHLNLTGCDTRDEDERDRFIQYDVGRRARVPPTGVRPDDPSWFPRFIQNQNDWLQIHHNWTAKYGPEAISPSAVTFHKVQPPFKMKVYERIFYRMKDENFNSLDCGTTLTN
jgi:hypothetical protein